VFVHVLDPSPIADERDGSNLDGAGLSIHQALCDLALSRHGRTPATELY
jgi:hypothetical protein